MDTNNILQQLIDKKRCPSSIEIKGYINYYGLNCEYTTSPISCEKCREEAINAVKKLT